jgi:hypothetical protein
MVSSEDPSTQVTEYTAQIYTASARGSGTDAQVCIRCMANGETSKVPCLSRKLHLQSLAQAVADGHQRHPAVC